MLLERMRRANNRQYHREANRDAAQAGHEEKTAETWCSILVPVKTHFGRQKVCRLPKLKNEPLDKERWPTRYVPRSWTIHVNTRMLTIHTLLTINILKLWKWPHMTFRLVRDRGRVQGEKHEFSPPSNMFFVAVPRQYLIKGCTQKPVNGCLPGCLRR